MLPLIPGLKLEIFFFAFPKKPGPLDPLGPLGAPVPKPPANLVPPKKPAPVLRSGTSPSRRVGPILDSKKLRANPDRVASTEPGLKLLINLS